MLLGTVAGGGASPREFMLDCVMSMYPVAVVRRRFSWVPTPLDGRGTSWKRLRVCWSAGSSGGVRADELIEPRCGIALDADRGCCGNGGTIEEPIGAVGTMVCGGGIWLSCVGAMWFCVAFP